MHYDSPRPEASRIDERIVRNTVELQSAELAKKAKEKSLSERGYRVGTNLGLDGLLEWEEPTATPMGYDAYPWRRPLSAASGFVDHRADGRACADVFEGTDRPGKPNSLQSTAYGLGSRKAPRELLPWTNEVTRQVQHSVARKYVVPLMRAHRVEMPLPEVQPKAGSNANGTAFRSRRGRRVWISPISPLLLKHTKMVILNIEGWQQLPATPCSVNYSGGVPNWTRTSKLP